MEEKCVEELIEILKLFQVSYDGDETIRYFEDEDDIVKALAQFLIKADYRRVPSGAIVINS